MYVFNSDLACFQVKQSTTTIVQSTIKLWTLTYAGIVLVSVSSQVISIILA